MSAQDDAAPRPGRGKTRTWHGRPECGAKTRKKAEDGGGAGAPCRQPAGAGTDHPGVGRCRFHGGATESGVKHAARVKAEAEVRAYNEPQAIAAREALQQELDRANSHVQWLERKLADPDPTDPKDAAYLYLSGQERDRLAKVAEAGLRVDLDGRQVRLEEEQGRIVAELIRAVVADLGLDPYSVRVRQVVRRHLLAVGSGEEVAS